MEPQKAPSLLNAGPPARAVIQAVVFDLGRVMIDFDHMVAVERIRKFTDKADQEIFDLIFNSELTRLFEEGRLNPRDFFCRLKTMLGLRLEYAEFVPIWNEIFFLTDENRRIYRLAQRLKERFTIALLSNVNRLHFEYILSLIHI